MVEWPDEAFAEGGMEARVSVPRSAVGAGVALVER